MTSVDGEQIAVPSDGFSNLLFYRKDLFEAAGLPEPKTYADIEKAAKELNKGKTAGIVAATHLRTRSPSRPLSTLRSPTAASSLTTAAISP